MSYVLFFLYQLFCPSNICFKSCLLNWIEDLAINFGVHFFLPEQVKKTGRSTGEDFSSTALGEL